MVPKTSYPPSFHHPTLTTTIPPTTAQKQLSSFLTSTQTKPYLHPDSLLRSTGITYSASSGPSGGLALHHLRRIEAGLRGENLVAETEEELNAQFAEEEKLPDGDDSRLDAMIEKERVAKKRKRDEIEEWAENSSTAGGGVQELESFANTPMHASDWQDQDEYEQEQEVWDGEVGERQTKVDQSGLVPTVREHDTEGRVVGKKELSKEEKRARKQAKKARKIEEARKKSSKAGANG